MTVDAWRAHLADADVLAPRPASRGFGHPDAAAALAAAGGPPRARPDEPLLVLVNDPARATDSASALRALRAAVGARPVDVLVATGSHRFDAQARATHERGLRAAAAPDSICWHDASSGDHVPVGPAALDRRLAAAHDVVAIGSVEPHWFAGITGAHKTLTIGVMALDDIAANHRHALGPEPRPLRTEGNPIVDHVTRVLEHVCDGRRVVALQHLSDRWIAGDPRRLIAPSAAAARERWLHAAPLAHDLLVAVVEPPLDGSLYQAEKGVKNTEFAVRDGGTLILDAHCAQGIGPARFAELMGRTSDAQSARRHVEQHGYRLGDHKAVRLRALLDRGVRLGLVSPTFDGDDATACGLRVFRTRADAAAWALTDGPVRVAVVADAAHSVVVVG